MIRVLFTMFARAYMSFRECAVTDRSHEISEQAVCDLNTCLDKLAARCADLEAKIQACVDAAAKCAAQARGETLTVNKKRLMERARQHLIDKRGMTAELDRALHAANMIRRQVSTIVNSHMDSTIIGAMRQYAEAANRLGLSDKAAEVQALGDELADCMDDANRLQEALGGMSTLVPISGASAEDEAAELQAELEAFFSASTEPPLIINIEPADVAAGEPIATKAEAEGVGLRQRTFATGEVLQLPAVPDAVPVPAMMI